MENNDTSLCPLCRHENVKIFAVGECSHPVCYLCATKMRILCEQTYCAICRKELPRVYLVSDLTTVRPTIDQSRFTPIDETGDCGIYYPIKTEWIRRETEKLLRNFCPFCYFEYETFEVLRDHVRRAHRYFYCDLCVEHLNLFPHERKCYTRHDLVQHIRCGDRDDTSFKGHPLCRFCDDHFLDIDQLYQHMRKEHYYCHLCSNDNVYYSDFDLLRDHYRSNHYLCEIGQCKDVQFTNVFSTEIDFRAHQAAQHSKSKAEARQLGTIPVEFQSRSTRDRRQPQDAAHRGTFKSGEFNTQGNNSATRIERDEVPQEPAVSVKVPSIDEFPTLGERSSTPQNVPQQRGAWAADSSRSINSTEDFPALKSTINSASNTIGGQTRGFWREQQQSAPSVPTKVTAKKAPQSMKQQNNGTTTESVEEDFPALMRAANAKIPTRMPKFSAWSQARKSAKHTDANQPQMRLNMNHLIRDDDEDDIIRRPMSVLTTSTVPMTSSNIKIVPSTDLQQHQTKEKTENNKKQSVPTGRDFPALPSNNTAQQAKIVSSGVWATNETDHTSNSTTKQQKKKHATSSKKKFLQELHEIPAPSSSNSDVPAIGLTQLGQSLITEEVQQTPSKEIKIQEASSSANRDDITENKSPTPSNKNTSQQKKTKESKRPETPSKTDEIAKNSVPQSLVENETPLTTEQRPVSSIQSVPDSTSSAAILPPPGFELQHTVPPPPGFGTTPSSVPSPPSYIFHSTYAKQKEEFRNKLVELFDGNMTLFTEYDRFCEAFSQSKINASDYITYTKQLFNENFQEYFLELIFIMPNIDKQNELYTIWQNDQQPTSTATKTNWTRKNLIEDHLYICKICRQIMTTSDTDEHNNHHSDFNAQFPSLPAATLPIGRTGGKKNK